MGEKDKTQKLLVGCKDVCAELLNVFVYDGSEVVKETELLPAPTESICPQTDGEDTQGFQQFRDCSMYDMKKGSIHVLYNMENQSSIDRDLVLRCTGYDGMSYREQYRKGKKTSGRNRQGIYPVISLVLNWGKRPWKAAKSLRELLDYPVPEQAESYLNDYKLHVFDMRFLDQSIREKFHGDMRVVLDYLADPESLLRSRQPLRHPEEVLRMLHALSGDKRYLDCINTTNENKGGKTNMCEVMDMVINKGLNEGLTRGRREGLCEGLISTCKDFMLSYSETAAKLKEKYGFSDEETEKNMKLYW